MTLALGGRGVMCSNTSSSTCSSKKTDDDDNKVQAVIKTTTTTTTVPTITAPRAFNHADDSKSTSACAISATISPFVAVVSPSTSPCNSTTTTTTTSSSSKKRKVDEIDDSKIDDDGCTMKRKDNDKKEEGAAAAAAAAAKRRLFADDIVPVAATNDPTNTQPEKQENKLRHVTCTTVDNARANGKGSNRQVIESCQALLKSWQKEKNEKGHHSQQAHEEEQPQEPPQQGPSLRAAKTMMFDFAVKQGGVNLLLYILRHDNKKAQKDKERMIKTTVNKNDEKHDDSQHLTSSSFNPDLAANVFQVFAELAEYKNLRKAIIHGKAAKQSNDGSAAAAAASAAGAADATTNGGLSIVLDTLHLHVHEINVQVPGCTLLLKLARDYHRHHHDTCRLIDSNNNNNNYTGLIQEAILRAMQKHPLDELLQGQACGALANLAAAKTTFSSSKNSLADTAAAVAPPASSTSVSKADDKKVENGSMAMSSTTTTTISTTVEEAIVKAMQTHCQNVLVMQRGCLALMNLAVAAVAHSIIAGPSTKLQENNKAIENTQRGMCLGIGNYFHGLKSENQKILSAGGLDIVLQGMRGHKSQEGAFFQQVACRLLVHLTSSSSCSFEQNSSIEIITQKGGIEIILGAMQAHPQDLKIQRYACKALLQLAENMFNRLIIADKGGIHIIVTSIAQTLVVPSSSSSLSPVSRKDDENDKKLVREHGCELLGRLSINDDKRKEIVVRFGGAVMSALVHQADTGGKSNNSMSEMLQRATEGMDKLVINLKAMMER